MALVEIRDVHKVFTRGAERIEVFAGLTLDVAQGSFTALMGPSGSGKSTLLNLIAGLDTPTSGTVTVGGAVVSAMSPSFSAASAKSTESIVTSSRSMANRTAQN